MDDAYDKALRKRTQKAVDSFENELHYAVRQLASAMRDRTASLERTRSYSWFCQLLKTISLGSDKGSMAAWRTGASLGSTDRLAVRDASDFLSSLRIAAKASYDAMNSEELSYGEDEE